MTIDDLAAATQNEFQEIRREMATKHELNAATHEILGAIEEGNAHLSAQMSLLNDDFSNLCNRVDEIGGRLRVVEKMQ